MTSPAQQAATLKRRAARIVQGLDSSVPPLDRTARLQELGETLARLRGFYTTANGLADWAGRSRDYREAVTEVYASAPASEVDRIKGTVRYHIGEAVRRVAPAAELEALGLTDAGPAQRGRDARTAATAKRRVPPPRVPPHVTLERLITTAAMYTERACLVLTNLPSDDPRMPDLAARAGRLVAACKELERAFPVPLPKPRRR